MSRDLYAVHIGNLNAKTTEEQLRILFCGSGDIKEIYVQNKFNTQFTYAFVRYATLEEARQACIDVHGSILHGSAVAVTFAESTNQKLSGGGSFINSGKSISKKPFPRKEAGTHETETEIHRKLKKSLSELKNKNSELNTWMNIRTEEDTHEFMKDFKDILVSMAKTPQSIGVDAVMFGKTQDINDLENLIIDFHPSSLPNKEYLPFKVVDFDLCSAGLKK